MAIALTSSITDITIHINKILILFIPILFIADICAVYTYYNYIKFNHIKFLFIPILIGMLYGTYFLQSYSDIIIRNYVGYSLIFLSLIHYMIPFLQQSTLLTSSTLSLISSLSTLISSISTTSNKSSQSILLPYHRSNTNENNENNNINIIINNNNNDNSRKKYSLKLLYNQIKPIFYGLLIGYFTMISNVGGPVVVVYLIQLKIPPNELNGARSILFLIINILKITLQVYLNNLNFTDLDTITLIGGLSVISITFTLITSYFIMPCIRPNVFEKITWILVILSGLKLIWGV